MQLQNHCFQVSYSQPHLLDTYCTWFCYCADGHCTWNKGTAEFCRASTFSLVVKVQSELWSLLLAFSSVLLSLLPLPPSLLPMQLSCSPSPAIYAITKPSVFAVVISLPKVLTYIKSKHLQPTNGHVVHTWRSLKKPWATIVQCHS